MALRPCIICGEPTAKTRCPAHALRRDPGTQDRTGLGREHRRITEMVIRRWVVQNGWVCPGYRIPSHPVAPGGLTGDHKIPRKIRPDLALEPSNYSVLCQVCNSRKGARVD